MVKINRNLNFELLNKKEKKEHSERGIVRLMPKTRQRRKKNEPIRDKLENIKGYWDKNVKERGQELSATSLDFQLREVEVYHICKFFESIKKHVKVLDLGCGNGYLGAVLVNKFNNIEYIGLDYLPSMVESAKQRIKNMNAKGKINFIVGDAMKANELFEEEDFDIIITERLLVNLGSEKNQYLCVDNAMKLLKKGGFFLMLEGTLEGWSKLNEYRKKFNLAEIGNHWTVTRVVEKNMIPALEKKGLKLIKRQDFGMYYFLSRIVHPLDILPKEPLYSDQFNNTAKEIAKEIPEFNDIGRMKFFIFLKV